MSTNIIKFYKIIVRGNARGGVLYAPKSWPRPIAIDGEEVKKGAEFKIK